MAEMDIRVGSEVSGAVQGLQQVQAELNKTGDALKQLPSVTNQATFTLNNFTRVVQDAPFGIRGIANNIDPLIESFTRLRQQTLTTGGALRALGKVFLGPAGIALAVSTVTSLLVQYGDQLFGVSKASKEADEASKGLASSLAKELVELTSIVGLAQNANASQSDRAKAIQFLNQEYSQYLTNLDGEKISLDNIKKAYEEIIDTMLKQAIVKGLQEEIAKQVAETAKQIIKLETAREKERIGLDKNNKTKYESLSVDNKLAQIANDKNKAITDGTIAYNKQTQAEKAAIGTTNVYGMMIEGLKKNLMETLQPALNLVNKFKDLNEELKEGKKQKGLDFSSFLRIPTLKYPFEIKSPTDAEIKKAAQDANISRILSVLQGDIATRLKTELPEDKKIDIFGNIIKTKDVSTQGLLKTTEGVKKLEGYISQINKLKEKYKDAGIAFPKINLSGTINQLENDIRNASEAIGEFGSKGKENIQQLAETISGVLNPAFDAFFQAFEENKNAGKAFLQAFAQGIQSVIIEMIKLAAISAILSAIFPGGIGGLKGFEAIFTNLLGFRANGGPVSGGSPYIVGERGPELFVPAVSGGIVPNNQVGSFMGGGMGNSGGRSSVLRGQDILLAYARTQRSQIRVNG